MIDDAVPITEEWLREVGFKWHQFDLQPDKHWLLWVAEACGQWGSGHDDLGVELGPHSYDAIENDKEGWFCWLRSDISHRYSRFLHVRRVRTRGEVIRLVEGLTGEAWTPANHFYGSVRHPKAAEQIRADQERLDKRLAANPAWYETEKDESRGRPLREHMDAAIKNGGAK